VVYCDESRHTAKAGCPHWSIGSLWLPRAIRDSWTKRIRAVLAEHGMRGEVKWSKTSRLALPAYCALIDAFVADPEIRFRAIVVDHRLFDPARFHGGDRELGFYKLYYELLIKWIEPQQRYLMLLDHQTVKEADRFVMLRRVLERGIKGTAWIDDLTVVDSHASPLTQLVDLLTGAVSAAWCSPIPGTPKAELIAHLQTTLGRSLTAASAGPTKEKCNIFQIRLEA